MTSESNTEQPFALTSDERTLFRKLSWRLWVVGLGLCIWGAATRFLMLIASEAQRQETNLVPIAVFAVFSTAPTLCAAWNATRATRLQIDASKALFALLIALHAALTWLSFVMFLVVVGAIVAFVMFVGGLLTA